MYADDSSTQTNFLSHHVETNYKNVQKTPCKLVNFIQHHLYTYVCDVNGVDLVDIFLGPHIYYYEVWYFKNSMKPNKAQLLAKLI